MDRTIALRAASLAVLWLAACQPAPSAPAEQVTFSGTLVEGSELGEVKRHCADGLYLVADEGGYLTGQTTMLLLRAGGEGEPMFTDRRYLNRRVVVTAAPDGRRPACDALMCGCEEYLLVTGMRPVGE